MQPVIEALPFESPRQLLAKVGHLPGCILFESLTHHPAAQYSYLCFEALETISYKYPHGVAPFNQVQALLKQFNLKTVDGLPPFQGGLAGLLSYDLGKSLESLPAHKLDDIQFPDMHLGVYDVVIAWDHAKEQCWAISSGYPELNEAQRIARAGTRLQQVLTQLKQKGAEHQPIQVNKSLIKSNFKKEDYLITLQKTIDYIFAGDIFEVNISQRFGIEHHKNWPALDIYLQLAHANPAPFFAYYNLGQGRYIASSSPERFIRVQDRVVDTYPIKGTIPRGKTESQDKQNADILLNSIKDRAENIMIVDLMRNDLSRVCEPHSVKTPKICNLESFTKVHHLVSHVTGNIKAQFDNIDLIKASFPGGSITGAPKIRSMEIIHELEPTSRGPYTGSMAMFGFNGFMDTSILIRTFVINQNRLYFQAGGAIVADSEPLAEYQETLAKAEGLVAAICE